MKKIFSLSILLLFFFSCSKDQPEPEKNPTTNYVYLDPSVKPYKFKTGSYWVYINDSTSITDSIRLDSISTGFIITTPSVHGTTNQTRSEFYTIQLHSFGNSSYYSETLFGKYLIRNFSGNYFQFYGQPIYIANSPVGTSNRGMEIVSKLPSYTVNTTTFSQVDKIKITAASQSQQEFTYDTYLYYSDTIGLIKKEILLPSGAIESWSIKRWNVIK